MLLTQAACAEDAAIIKFQCCLNTDSTSFKTFLLLSMVLITDYLINLCHKAEDGNWEHVYKLLKITAKLFTPIWSCGLLQYANEIEYTYMWKNIYVFPLMLIVPWQHHPSQNIMLVYNITECVSLCTPVARQ